MAERLQRQGLSQHARRDRQHAARCTARVCVDRERDASGNELQLLARYGQNDCVIALGRRNYLFAGSDAGGDTAARLYSLVGSCRLNGIDPHLYLRYVLECIATHPINRIDELLPWRVGPLLPLALSRAA